VHGQDMNASAAFTDIKENTNMKSFSSIEKGYNRQFAAAYAAYMIVGSYFYKCEAANSYEEKHLYLHYVEMPMGKQIDCEKRIDDLMQNIEYNDPGFIESIASLKCVTAFYKDGEDFIVDFRTGGFESLQVLVDAGGRCTIALSS
jgi:hypothetical protein